MLKACVLGSSSAGNSTVIWNEKEAILIDCGFPLKYIRESLQELGIIFEQIRAILISHSHSDHVNTAVLNRAVKDNIALIGHPGVIDDLYFRYPALPKAEHLGLIQPLTENTQQLGSFSVKGFPVPHDSRGGCFGFNVCYENFKISMATDLGYSRNGLHRHFNDSDIIIMESNHDPLMLENSGRPQQLIDRIRKVGHLSNEECANLLELSIGGSAKKPQAIILSHISSECNTRRYALHSTSKMLERNGWAGISLHASNKKNPRPTIILE